MGTVVDILQRASACKHQRHMAVDHYAGGHRLTVPGGRNGRNIAIFHLRQDEQAGKPLLCIELRRHIVGDVQSKAAGHGQATAQPQVGDVADLVPGKARILRGCDAAGGILLQRTEHDPGQLQKGLCPPLPGHTVGLRNGQDEVLHSVKRPLRHLFPALEPGAQGAVGRQGALRQGGDVLLGGRPRAQHLPLFEQGIQCLPAQLVHGAAGDEPRSAVHFHRDLLCRKGGAAGLCQAAVQTLGGVGAGRLRLGIPIGKGLVAIGIGNGQLFAALLDFQFHLHRHAGAFAAVKLAQHGQGLFGQLGVGFAAHTEHGAVDFSVQIAGGETGAAEGVLQQVAVVGAALAARQTGADRRRHILRCAQTAFDFCRCYAKRLQLVQLVDGGVILEGEVVQPPGLALRQGVGFKGQAAGARTGAAIAAAPAQKGGHIALAAHAHAQRTVDEALSLDAAVLCDMLHLGQAQLTRQHHPGKAQLLQFQCALQGVDAHLGRAVPGQLRGNFTN